MVVEEIDNYLLKKNLDKIVSRFDSDTSPDVTNKTLSLIHTIHDKLNRLEMHIERKK